VSKNEEEDEEEERQNRTIGKPASCSPARGKAARVNLAGRGRERGFAVVFAVVVVLMCELRTQQLCSSVHVDGSYVQICSRRCQTRARSTHSALGVLWLVGCLEYVWCRILIRVSRAILHTCLSLKGTYNVRKPGILARHGYRAC
jgi:hypothetical protein